MKLRKNVSLKDYSTMRLGGKAAALVNVKNISDLRKALDIAKSEDLPIIMIGEGSNITWREEGFPGLVIVNRLTGIDKVGEDADTATYKVAAGEVWDDVVKFMVRKNLSGIECLSLIPGTAGATPVQNVGAYGQEIADTLISLEAYDREAETIVTMPNKDCDFAYRASRFKTKDKGRFLITSITLKLRKSTPKPPFYASLEQYFKDNNITDFSPKSLRKAVIDIRSSKLPDPQKVANNGSYFANPIVSTDVFKKIKASHPDVAAWEYDGKYKISAGWLIEKSGMKGVHDPETGMATSDKNALVLINEKAHSSQDLIKFRNKIVSAVKDKFGITLEQEPELLP